MDNATKAKALFAIYKHLSFRARFQPETHLALRKVEKIKRAFSFYGLDTMWTGRLEELAKLFDEFQFARTYTNEFGKTGFKLVGALNVNQ